MLRIGADQIEALSAPEGECYPWVEDHVRRCFPDFAATIDAAALRAFVREAHRRALHFQITSGPGVCRFVDLSVYLGLGFEDQPENVWATTRLGDPAYGNADQRVELVARMAVDRDTPMWPAP